MAAKSSKPGRRGPVLVVDDDVALRSELAEFLERMGYAVMVASDGNEALEKAQAARPSVVVMDVGMPQLDGLRAAEILTLLRHTEQVVLMSGVPEQIAAAAERQGIAALLLTKPIDLEALLRIVDGLTLTRRPAPAGA